MAAFVRGDVVVVPWPMAVADTFKHRPAIVLGLFQWGAETAYLMCAISATADPADDAAIQLRASQMQSGTLDRDSWIKPHFMFTIAEKAIVRKVGSLTPHFLALTMKGASELLS